MLLKTILIPVSAILAVVSALPAGTDTLVAGTEIEARAALPTGATPGGYEDEGEIIDITDWVPSNVDSSADTTPISARELDGYSITCGHGKSGVHTQFLVWFRQAGNRQICMKHGETKTWVSGRNRFKAANRTGKLRCNKLSTFGVNVGQMSECGRPGFCGKSCWGRDKTFPEQTFALYGV